MKISHEQLAERLRAALGADALSAEPRELELHSVAGKLPALVCLPHSAEQIAAALRICAEAEASVVPWGGGTAMAIGNPPRRLDLVVSTIRMNRLIEHDHANLTVTVQSGITLGSLQTALVSQKQFAPFDAPCPERTTVGGIVAANLNGPKRSSYGSVRDLVIGMKVVLGTGEQIKAGGKVVKNVAGYDLCKLFTGSLGSLGILTEATIRVAPVPESSATLVASGTLAQTLQLAGTLANSKLLPSAVLLCNSILAQNWQLAVGFEGFAETVARQLGDLDAMARRLGMSMASHRGENQQRVWQDIRDLPLQPDRLTYRITVPRSSVAEMIGAVQSWRTGAQEPAISADIAMGTLWIISAANKISASHFAELISLAQQHRGHAVMFAAPANLKDGIEVWGPSPPSFALMRDIKEHFDPKGIMNPGRFVGGL